MRTITIEIAGRPPTPNARPGNWQVVAREKAAWKDKAWLAAIASFERDFAAWPVHTVMIDVGTKKRPRQEPRLVASVPMQYARVEVAIVVPTLGRHDWDNGVASLKPLFDGMVTAGVVVDDSVERLPARRVEFVHVAHLSKVVMRFTEVDAPGSLGL
jgi:hypothetical protein